MANIVINELNDDNFEIGFTEPKRIEIDEDEPPEEITEEEKT